MNANLRNFALWAVVVLLLMFASSIVFQYATSQKTSYSQPPAEVNHTDVDQNKISDVKSQGLEYYGPFLGSQTTTSQDISFSELLTDVDSGRVKEVLIQGPEIHGTFTDGRTFQTYSPSDPTLIQRLYNKGVTITAQRQTENVPALLISWLPFVALIGVWVFLSRQMQGAGGKALGFGKSRAKLLTDAHGRVTFEDVAGVDEAKQDLQEIVEFLRDPGKFQRLGGAFRAACCWSVRPAPARR